MRVGVAVALSTAALGATSGPAADTSGAASPQNRAATVHLFATAELVQDRGGYTIVLPNLTKAAQNPLLGEGAVGVLLFGVEV